MQRNDYLWKGILEHVFEDFLRFFFKDADKLFDIDRGFTFLDKELADLFPDEAAKSPRFVDKLIKVFMQETNDKLPPGMLAATENPVRERWILVHVEVQGYRDNHFAWRMFTYFYRIFDRYRQPVTAIAILTDGEKNYRPSFYEYDFLGTRCVFRFNTYKVLDQNEEALRNDKNPFAAVILTVLTALKNKNIPDQELFGLKYRLLRNLYRHGIPQYKIDKLIIFLQLYVVFRKKEYTQQFEYVIEEVTQNKNTSMGIRELVLERTKEEGRLEGIARSEYEKNVAFTESLIRETDFDDAKIAKLVNVGVDFVARIRAEMAAVK